MPLLVRRELKLLSGFWGPLYGARGGPPSKLTTAETQRLLTWAREAPLTLMPLQARHDAAGGTPVHVNTLPGALKRGGFVWKRIRHSLKKIVTPPPLPGTSREP